MKVDPHLVTAIAALSPYATDWRRQLLQRLHDDALFEAMRRRGGPRTAREHSARDWYLQRRDPAIIAAAVAAYAEHKLTSTAPRRRTARKRATAKWRIGMDLALGGDAA